MPDNDEIDTSRRSLLRTVLMAPPALGAVALAGCDVDAAGVGDARRDTVVQSELPTFQITSQVVAGENLTTGTILYSDPVLPLHTLIVVKGADNQATRFEGIDATGVNDGDVKIFLNWSESGHDCGQVVLKHLADGVDPANQIVCPGDDDYYIPIHGGVMLVYGAIPTGDLSDSTYVPQWHVVDSGGWGKRVKVQSLNFYPTIRLPELSGGYDNMFALGGTTNIYSPGLAGGDMDLKSYSVVRAPVAASGAVLTGLAPDNATNGAESALGPVKILMNEGPGALTLKHATNGTGYGDGVTAAIHQFNLPQARDIVLQPGETAMLISLQGSDPDPDSRWRVIALGQTTAQIDTMTARSEVLSPSVSALLPGFASGVTSDWDPGATDAIVRVETDPSGSVLGGLVGQTGAPKGERRLLVVVGNGPLILVNEDPDSSAANRFDLPGSEPYMVTPRGGVWITRDATSHWKPDVTVGAIQSLQIDITPAVMPAGNLDDWNPVGAISFHVGLGFEYANWIRAQGSSGGTTLRSLFPTYHGRRIMMTNYTSAIAIAYAVHTTGGGCPFYGPGTSFTLEPMATTWLTFDGLNQLWLVGT